MRSFEYPYLRKFSKRFQEVSPFVSLKNFPQIQNSQLLFLTNHLNPFLSVIINPKVRTFLYPEISERIFRSIFTDKTSIFLVSSTHALMLLVSCTKKYHISCFVYQFKKKRSIEHVHLALHECIVGCLTFLWDKILLSPQAPVANHFTTVDA